MVIKTGGGNGAFYKVAILLASGTSQRLVSQNSTIQHPKPFLLLDQQTTILEWCVQTFITSNLFDAIYVVTNPDYVQHSNTLLNKPHWKQKVHIITGNHQSRNHSLQLAVKAVSQISQVNHQTVLLFTHDVARVFVTPQILQEHVSTLVANPNLVVATTIASNDAFWLTQPMVDQFGYLPPLLLQQTPQSASFQTFAQIYLPPNGFWLKNPIRSDFCLLAQTLGYPITHVRGAPINFKITTPFDFFLAQQLVTKPNFKEGAY